jgi:hypothetical protein
MCQRARKFHGHEASTSMNKVTGNDSKTFIQGMLCHFGGSIGTLTGAQDHQECLASDIQSPSHGATINCTGAIQTYTIIVRTHARQHP